VDWINNEVAIGNYLEAQDAALLKQHGLRSVLSLDGTLTANQATTLELSEIASYRLLDGAGNDLRLFRVAVEDLGRLAASHPPVLVQCHAGRSRSVAVVAGYLMQRFEMEAEEAVAVIAARREINLAGALMELLYRL
jgi:protein-tyrosine phosphatase